MKSGDYMIHVSEICVWREVSETYLTVGFLCRYTSSVARTLRVMKESKCANPLGYPTLTTSIL